MCTVTYLPKIDGCLITSNRDETVFRGLAEPPDVRLYKQTKVLTPKDPQAGGTWIACSADMAVCLYNGAFEPHIRQPPYQTSRGYVPLDCLAQGDINAFIKYFNPLNIEPFSLVVYKNQSLVELKWDAVQLHRIDHDPTRPHIWASVTLYPLAIRKNREKLFDRWLSVEPNFTVSEIIRFHTQRDEQNMANGLLMEREQGLRTVSVTSLDFKLNGTHHITHVDLVGGKTVQAKFS
jgi:hypothetical protein